MQRPTSVFNNSIDNVVKFKFRKGAQKFVMQAVRNFPIYVVFKVDMALNCFNVLHLFHILVKGTMIQGTLHIMQIKRHKKLT